MHRSWSVCKFWTLSGRQLRCIAVGPTAMRRNRTLESTAMHRSWCQKDTIFQPLIVDD